MKTIFYNITVYGCNKVRMMLLELISVLWLLNKLIPKEYIRLCYLLFIIINLMHLMIWVIYVQHILIILIYNYEYKCEYDDVYEPLLFLVDKLPSLYGMIINALVYFKRLGKSVFEVSIVTFFSFFFFIYLFFL